LVQELPDSRFNPPVGEVLSWQLVHFWVQIGWMFAAYVGTVALTTFERVTEFSPSDTVTCTVKSVAVEMSPERQLVVALVLLVNVP
jgi:hypothetical protein